MCVLQVIKDKTEKSKIKDMFNPKLITSVQRLLIIINQVCF